MPSPRTTLDRGRRAAARTSAPGAAAGAAAKVRTNPAARVLVLLDAPRAGIDPRPHRVEEAIAATPLPAGAVVAGWAVRTPVETAVRLADRIAAAPQLRASVDALPNLGHVVVIGHGTEAAWLLAAPETVAEVRCCELDALPGVLETLAGRLAPTPA